MRAILQVMCQVQMGQARFRGLQGLDCSGFVSAAYGFSTKSGTYGLDSDLNIVSSVSGLASMDCLVKPGSHAVLFSSWINQTSGQFVLAESNNPADYDDRTALRTKYISDYVGIGYNLRTKW